jgi:hypothetical protein
LLNNLSSVSFSLFLHDANIFSGIVMFVIGIEFLMADSVVFESCREYEVAYKSIHYNIRQSCRPCIKCRDGRTDARVNKHCITLTVRPIHV